VLRHLWYVDVLFECIACYSSEMSSNIAVNMCNLSSQCAHLHFKKAHLDRDYGAGVRTWSVDFVHLQALRSKVACTYAVGAEIAANSPLVPAYITAKRVWDLSLLVDGTRSNLPRDSVQRLKRVDLSDVAGFPLEDLIKVSTMDQAQAEAVQVLLY
jgi:hypothetical protein